MINYKVNINGTDIFISDHPTPTEATELKLTPKLEKELTTLLGIKEKDVPGKITWPAFVEMYNSAAKKNSWVALTERNKETHKRFLAARRDYPLKEEWEVIIGAMENDPFYSGKSGIYTNPKAMTLFRDSRYNEFYEVGMHNKNAPKKETVDDILDTFRGML